MSYLGHADASEVWFGACLRLGLLNDADLGGDQSPKTKIAQAREDCFESDDLPAAGTLGCTGAVREENGYLFGCSDDDG